MKIIIVEDDEQILEYLKNLIQELEKEAETIGFTTAGNALEYLSNNKIDIAFLDIELGDYSGIELANQCKKFCPCINIIFITGHSQYMIDAFKLHASGYLLKPFRREELCAELADLRHSMPPKMKDRIQIHTFGHFEIFVDGRQLDFTRAKCKECLAYLVDRKGARVTYATLSTILWEDKPFSRSVQNNTQKVVSDLIQTLANLGIDKIIVKSRLGIAIVPNLVNCDYYDAIKDDKLHLNAASGEYMSNYSWAEFTVANISKRAT